MSLPIESLVPPRASKRIVVGLCMPIADQLHYRTLNSLFNAFGGTPREVGLQWFGKTDAPVAEARNLLVDGILKEHPEVTHLMWIDDDMVFPPDAIARLLAHDLPIVGGVCHNRRHPFMPILMMKVPSGIGYGFMYDYEERADARGLVPVDATGAAFILVKREVYEKIAEKLNKEKHEGPYTQLGAGEDISFCSRAQQVGYPIWIDTTLQIGHVGEVVVDDAFARRNRDCYAMPWFQGMNTTAAVAEKLLGPPLLTRGEEPSDAEHAAIRGSGLRMDGYEVDDEGRRHRARYAWAGHKLGRMIPVGTVLDYGCGVGYGCKILTRTAAEAGGGLAVCGYDVDPSAVAFGRKRWWEQITAVEEEALGGGPYAAITAFEVMEHLDAHPGETLRRLLSLAPVVIGSVPYAEPEGFNPHHKHANLHAGLLEGLNHEVFGQRWDGTIGPLEGRDTTPIMLFVVRR